MLRLGLLLTFLIALLAAPAQAATLSKASDMYEWSGGSDAETLTVAPQQPGQYKFTSSHWITVSAAADPLCSPSAATVTCSATGIGGISAFGAGGGDTLTMELSAAGEPKAMFFVWGGAGNDVITGGSDDDIVYAGTDTDTIDGRAGGDSLHGEEGTDTVTGGEGDDFVNGEEDADTVSGGNGNDSVRGGDGVDDVEAGAGDDIVDGGTGNEGTLDGGTHVLGDTVRYLDRTTGVTANITTTAGYDGDAGEDAVNFEKLGGSNDDDHLYGGAGADSIEGFGGNDDIQGMGGHDVLLGGSDADTILGGAGNDDIQGDSGADTLDGGANNDFVNGNNDDDRFVAEPGSDALDGGSGTDTADYSARNEPIVASLNGAGFDDGGASDDTDGGGPLTARDQALNVEVLRGGTQNDVFTTTLAAGVQLIGNDGNDELTGGDKADKLDGGNGNDTLTGKGDPDKLEGGAGNDTLDGGLGADVFLAGADVDDLRSDDGVYEMTVDCGDGAPDKVRPDAMDKRIGCEDDTVLAAAAAAAKAKQDAYNAQVAANKAKYEADVAARKAAYEAEQRARMAAYEADAARRRALYGGTTGTAGNTRALPLVRAVPVAKFTRVGSRGSRAKVLRVTTLPRGARVQLRCISRARGACAVRSRAFTPRNGSVDLAGALRGRLLPAGTRLHVDVSAPGSRPMTIDWTIRAGKAPRLLQSR